MLQDDRNSNSVVLAQRRLSRGSCGVALLPPPQFPRWWREGAGGKARPFWAACRPSGSRQRMRASQEGREHAGNMARAEERDLHVVADASFPDRKGLRLREEPRAGLGHLSAGCGHTGPGPPLEEPRLGALPWAAQRPHGCSEPGSRSLQAASPRGHHGPGPEGAQLCGRPRNCSPPPTPHPRLERLGALGSPTTSPCGVAVVLGPCDCPQTRPSSGQHLWGGRPGGLLPASHPPCPGTSCLEVLVADPPRPGRPLTVAAAGVWSQVPATASNLPSSQRLPLNPGLQSQLWASTPGTQVPPF